jgi:hypothetical protein
MNGTSKIVPAETEVAEAPCVKEEQFWDEEEDHCFVYEKAKAQGGLYPKGSCIELPFS